MTKDNAYDFDVVIVGAGLTGGIAARELTARGLKVLLVERGGNVKHGSDYVAEHKMPWEFEYRGLGDRRRILERQQIQRKSGNFEEGSTQFWVDDIDYPYEQDVSRPFNWIRGYQVGGRSITWGRATPRFGMLAFEEPAKDGLGIDWPIRYSDIAPWYSHVERYIGVSSVKAENDSVPDGEFLPPMPMNCVEEYVSEVLRKEFDGRMMIPERSAVLSQAHNGRSACHFCGPCHRGCSTKSYFSSVSVAIPDASATGLLTLMPETCVTRLVYDQEKERVCAINVVNEKTRTRSTFTAKVFFLNASTIATAHLLLLSANESFPSGLANRSDQVGRNLMDHAFGATVTARMPGFDQERDVGNRPSLVYIPRFRNVGNDKQKFVRGYGYQGRAWRERWSRGGSNGEIGQQLKSSLRKPGDWMMRLNGFGDCLPNSENRVRLHPHRLDKWGTPLPSISFSYGNNEKLIIEDAAREAARMLIAAGGKIVGYRDQLRTGGEAIHEMGTARMGIDPRTSVLNSRNQCHDIRNLYVTDGACMTSSGSANPSLTYMALAARASHHAADELAAGRF